MKRLLILLAFISSYGFSLFSSEGRAIFVLFDTSGSTKEDRNFYWKVFKKSILADIRRGDVIGLGEITSNSLSSCVVEAEFAYGWNENPFIVKKKQEEAKRTLRQKAKEFLFGNKEARSTDIFNAAYIAEEFFKDHPQAKKILVLMSDMVQTLDYNFNRRKFFSQEEINEIIDRERVKKGLPDLRGVEVYVIGARSSDPTKVFRLKRFWAAYFSKCGASLRWRTSRQESFKFD